MYVMYKVLEHHSRINELRETTESIKHELEEKMHSREDRQEDDANSSRRHKFNLLLR